MDRKLIISFGEIVWDQFDDTATLGGAPLNVAYHLHAGGWPILIISRIGHDELGGKTLEKVEHLGLPVQGIQQDVSLPTGRVLISLDENNEPDFEIAAPAAWDGIEANEAFSLLKNAQFHLIFGTLAQRQETSRGTLCRLWEKADTKFYDVNLRPPHTRPELVLESLKAADVVKVNLEELHRLNEWFVGAKGTHEAISRDVLDAYDLSLLAVTNGDKGAWLAGRAQLVKHPGFKITAVDPVGSGDAFFAALISGYLSGLSLEKCLERANRQGAWVASRQGATPRYADR